MYVCMCARFDGVCVCVQQSEVERIEWEWEKVDADGKKKRPLWRSIAASKQASNCLD